MTVGDHLQDGALVEVHSIGLELTSVLQSMVELFDSHGISSDRLVFIYTDKDAKEYSMNGQTIESKRNPKREVGFAASVVAVGFLCIMLFKNSKN